MLQTDGGQPSHGTYLILFGGGAGDTDAADYFSIHTNGRTTLKQGYTWLATDTGKNSWVFGHAFM